jgi:hypothetical protein
MITNSMDPGRKKEKRLENERCNLSKCGIYLNRI